MSLLFFHLEYLKVSRPNFATLCLISHFEISYTTRGENYLANYQGIRYGPPWMTFLPCGITGIINIVQIEKALCCGFKRNNKILEPYLRTLIYSCFTCTSEKNTRGPAVIHIVRRYSGRPANLR